MPLAGPGSSAGISVYRIIFAAISEETHTHERRVETVAKYEDL